MIEEAGLDQIQEPVAIEKELAAINVGNTIIYLMTLNKGKEAEQIH